MDCILLRYGEIGLKSKKTRIKFEKLYVQAIEDALKRNGINEFKIKNLGGRFVVHNETIDETIEVLKRVPGIQSLSPAIEFEFNTKEELLKKIKELAEDKVKNKTFCVKVKRVGNHNFNSMDLGKEAGAKLYEESAGVKFKNPDLSIFLEIRDNKCFMYTKTIDGIGGLPSKSSGKVLCLFSGGIDSPVAAFQMLKRGCEADFLYINLVEEKSLNDVAKVYNYLIDQYAFGYKPKIYVVDGRELVEKIKNKVEDRLRQIAIKIVFYKLGEKILKENKEYVALVTGEALSQKSSQTVQGLNVIQSQIKVLVLRPLIGYDKIEITKIAEKIGTLVSSIQVKEYCSLSEGKVVTTPNQKVLEKIPSCDELINNVKIDQYEGFLEINEETDFNEIKEMKEFISIDIRSKGIQKIRPLKTNLSIPYPTILEEWVNLEKDKNYVLICSFGVVSENIAFKLRKKGINAKGINAKGISVRNFNKKYYSEQIH